MSKEKKIQKFTVVKPFTLGVPYQKFDVFESSDEKAIKQLSNNKYIK
jgi:hypothetical protein